MRSPHPHADIRGIEVAEASAMPGVVAILTAGDYRGDGLRPIGHRANPAGAVDHRERSFGARGGATVIDLPHWPLAEARVRHIGDPVALVVAGTPAEARDAAERIAVDYRPLPAVTAAQDALAEGAPQLWDDAPGNLCIDEQFGDPEAIAALFAQAAHVVRGRFHNGRIVNCQMEPRSVIGSTGEDGLTVIAGSQGVMRHVAGLREIMDLPEDGVRVVCPDVGGGFG
ncbi:MAG: molybdopterin cofactor-binding domain-containing protein, partial [Bauldia litoralis]